MQIEYQQDGGFAALPGLSTPYTIDTDDLSAAQARKLTQLVKDADFFTLKSESRLLPDAFHYTITVRDGRRRHTVQFSDPIEDHAVADLIAYIQELRRAE